MIELTIKRMKDHIWLVITLFSVLCFLSIFIFNLIPYAFEIFYLHHEIGDKKQKIDQVSQWEELSDQLEGRKKILKSQMRQFLFNQRQDTHLSTIIQFLSQTAGSEEVDLSSIKPQEIIQSRNHIALPIELTLTATYHQVARFINSIETAEHIIKIQRVKLNATSITSNQLFIELHLMVYYLQ